VRLLKRGRKLLRVRGSRALATSGCADKCCDGGCANYVLVRWCCDPERTAWAFMNRRDCPDWRDWMPSLSPTEPQTFKVTADPASACWTTDPVPEGNVRRYADIPANAVFIPFGPDSVIVDGCDVPECLNCPECCGSKELPLPCGDYGPTTCCECGDNYTLTITETARTTVQGTDYEYPCTVGLSTGHSQPAAEQVFTRTASFTFTCDPDTGQRIVTGTSSVNGRLDMHYANIRVRDDNACELVSIARGRTQTTLTDYEQQWTDLHSGQEGCGLTRSEAGILLPTAIILGMPFDLTAYGVFRYDVQGDCSGQFERSIEACSTEGGGPNGRACQFGIGTIRSSVAWSGSQACDGGSFEESGTFVGLASLPVALTNQAGTFEGLWNGTQAGSWFYSCRWNVTGGDPCRQDPCANQNPVGFAKSTSNRVDTLPIKPGASIADMRDTILQKRLGKRCNCGKK